MFGLKGDPFGTSDYMLEQESGKQYARIKTLAIKHITALAKTGTNVILAGPKGAGKSTAMAEAGKELDNCLVMAGFRTTADVYNYLWKEILNNYRNDLEALKGRFNQGDFIQLPMWFKMERCGYKKCPRQKFSACALQTKGEDSEETYFDKRKRKEFFVKYRTFKKICEELFLKKEKCPMKRSIVNMLLDSRLPYFKGKVYLYDVHDELLTSKWDSAIINELLSIFQRLGTVVITATIDQCTKLSKHEALARIKVMNFPLPTDEELKQIFVERVRAFQTPNVNVLPFSDEAVELLIRCSHNVTRIFIQRCSDVYLGMLMEGREVPADREFVLKALGNKVSAIDETSAVEFLVNRLKEEKKGWVKVRVLSGMLSEVYGVDVGERRLGRRLKQEWKLPQRNNDGSEFKF